MKPSTNQCLGHERLSSANTSSTVTATVPAGTSAVLISVETTACRMTLLAAGDPTSNVGHLLQPTSMPWTFLIGQGCTLKFASSAGTVSVIQISYLS